MEDKIYSVSEISREIKRVIEQFIPPVWVEGEISNYSISRVGHIYFSLKDENALINCVMWRNVAGSILFHLAPGMRVIVRGDILAYSAQSQYQINVKEIRAAGMGSLFMAFEALKNKLSQEGLFDPEQKKPIPAFPKRIGVITSITGAAVRDIIEVSGRRNPAVQLVIFPAQVQGEKAADTIIEGIQTFNQLKNVDFIILGRGGGSIEDLWAFNEEKLVRAVAASELPIISAVGHEVDFTLSDFVADFRAPTPSAAAELAVPERNALEQKLVQYRKRSAQLISHIISQKMQFLDNLYSGIVRFNPEKIVADNIRILAELKKRLRNSVAQKINQTKLRLNDYRSTIHALNPKEILKRGFSIVYTESGNKVVRSVSEVIKGNKITVEVFDGRYKAEVKSVNKQEP
ncbi:exodeoxyribonuclease VII large subunit [bacterium]|nr:exodeoxyribonuclease VII large subunit [bacterium]MBU1066081.1 exodeoxyribonuclease VII large subunit [bacterium]MBU1635374.1 exodeoxyribonuclease VII large subunit [bacterium]MBU1874519.1 exodeoxyribonuclease VII large subunit [bacterium]